MADQEGRFMNNKWGPGGKAVLPGVVVLAGLATASSGCIESATGGYGVAMIQSSKAQATDLTTHDIAELVSSAVSSTGGLTLIKDGQTVVLKPTLVTFYQDAGENTASDMVNGVATDWRVVKAVADLVRERNPTGRILVMEGSTVLTSNVYPVLGYTSANFGSSVDEFLGLEANPTSCSDASTAGLEQRQARSGKVYWFNSRYLSADVIIDIPTLATDAWAGIGGAIESAGTGATPAGQYSSGDNSIDCTRTKIDRSNPEVLGEFIRDYYAVRPADFVVVDGLQGVDHGPVPAWDDSGTYGYADSTKNMRLILAGSNALAVDTVGALVMKCDPKKVPYLAKLEADGLGTTDPAKISVVGKRVADVARAFASRQTGICPGK